MVSPAGLLTLPVWLLAVVAVIFIAVTFFIITSLRKLLVNSVLGLLALFIINWLGKGYGIAIGINILTVLFTAVLGLAGVGLLIILNLAGIKF